MRLSARHVLSLLLTATLGAIGCAVSTPHTSRQLGHGDMATWRATSTTNDARRLYGGLHLVTGWLLDGEGFGGGNLGLVGGWESKPGKTGNTFQVELSLAPLAMN